ncbi:MAG: 23S rRNA (guanosine(2251)-2'-O)-methyltransferase RlmB [Candidatus Aminicenantes bacterium]|nr:23S rRNA (guanosine(2251)-2'-O)-methyltransferase RlmB [Candidatus Aminicenantes bacterium]
MAKICRFNPLLELLRSQPGRVQKIFLQRGKRQDRFFEVIQKAQASRIPLVYVPKTKIDSMARNHQGFVALVMEKSFSPVEEMLEGRKRPLLLLLDGIEDPQNLGAIIRTAEGAGVDGILLPERRSAGISETVARVSAGALAHVRIGRIKNVVQTLTSLKDRGLWVVGAEGGTGKNWDTFDYTVPLVLVLGSEGKGLRPLVRENCDQVLSIPLFGQINSLNVGAAAAIFLYEIIRQRLNIE